MTPAELVAAQAAVQSVHASDALLDYLQSLIATTRSGAWFVEGLSPRAGVAVLRAARARALLGGRDYVAPDDIQYVLPQTIAHRLVPVAGAGRGPQRAGAGDDRGRAAAVNAASLVAPWNVRARVRGWLTSRLPRTDTQLLTQGNVYILPTRAGWMFALTLVVLLLASVNYQLNLGYVLTFLLAGSGIVSMHITHGTLRGLTLHLRPVAPAFAGSPAVLDIVMSSPSSARFGVGLRLLDAPASTLAWTNVPAGGAVDRARQLRADGARPPRRADALGRDALSARPVSRLDGLATARPAARLSARRGRRAGAARGPARGRRRRPRRGAAKAARSRAFAPTGAATRSS